MGWDALLGLHPEVFTQVDSTNGIVLNNLVGLAFCQDASLADDVSVVANAQSFTHIVVGN